MDTTDFVLNKLRHDITEHGLQLKAIIQDINTCAGPLVELHALNSAGRSKISGLRKFIDKFGDIAKEDKNPELLKEVVLHREQLASDMDFFKKANLKSMLVIEKNSKDELLKSTNEEMIIRNRQRKDKESLAKMSSNVTDQLLSISRQLADTTERSARTLETLTTSSDTVTNTQEELKITSGSITESGQLLKKYGRREFTDKVLMFFACIFFLLVFFISYKKDCFKSLLMYINLGFNTKSSTTPFDILL